MQIKLKHIPAPPKCRDTITCHVVLLDGSDITVGKYGNYSFQFPGETFREKIIQLERG